MHMYENMANIVLWNWILTVSSEEDLHYTHSESSTRTYVKNMHWTLATRQSGIHINKFWNTTLIPFKHYLIIGSITLESQSNVFNWFEILFFTDFFFGTTNLGGFWPISYCHISQFNSLQQNVLFGKTIKKNIFTIKYTLLINVDPQ